MKDTRIHSSHRWFDDFNEGDTFAFGRWLMTRDDMLAYAKMYDPEPFHVDEEAAKALGWGALIASGPQVASICRRLQKDGFPNAEIVISPGWDRIQWFSPVYAEDLLTCRARVLETKRLSSRPREGLVKLENDILRQDGKTVARIVTNWFMREAPAS
jgi:acyl dehydratase